MIHIINKYGPIPSQYLSNELLQLPIFTKEEEIPSYFLTARMCDKLHIPVSNEEKVVGFFSNGLSYYPLFSKKDNLSFNFRRIRPSLEEDLVTASELEMLGFVLNELEPKELYVSFAEGKVEFYYDLTPFKTDYPVFSNVQDLPLGFITKNMSTQLGLVVDEKLKTGIFVTKKRTFEWLYDMREHLLFQSVQHVFYQKYDVPNYLLTKTDICKYGYEENFQSLTFSIRIIHHPKQLGCEILYDVRKHPNVRFKSLHDSSFNYRKNHK